MKKVKKTFSTTVEVAGAATRLDLRARRVGVASRATTAHPEKKASEKSEKGKTARGDHVAGARRTLAVAPEVLWAFVVSAAGQKWLGGKAALKSKTSDVTTFVAGSHYRRRVPEGLLQVRVLVAPRGRSTLALHMENLPDADARAEALVRMRRALDGIERVVSDAPPPGEKAKKTRR